LATRSIGLFRVMMVEAAMLLAGRRDRAMLYSSAREYSFGLSRRLLGRDCGPYGLPAERKVFKLFWTVCAPSLARPNPRIGGALSKPNPGDVPSLLRPLFNVLAQLRTLFESALISDRRVRRLLLLLPIHHEACGRGGFNRQPLDHRRPSFQVILKDAGGMQFDTQ